MKESPRKRHTSPFLSDEENDKNFCNNRELELSIVEEDFTTNLESLEKASSYSLAKKAKELYVDKNVTECQLPEFIACYHESGFHVVKDICVDEGISHGEKIEDHRLSCNPINVNGDKHDNMIEEEDLGTQFLKNEQLISSPVEDCGKNPDLFSKTKDKLHADFLIPNHSISHTNIEGNLDSSFGSKEKTDTNLIVPEPTDDHRHMGNCNDTEIHGQNQNQNSSQGKDGKEDATDTEIHGQNQNQNQNSSQGKDGKEDATEVANHSVIPNDLENVSEDATEVANHSVIAHSTENCSPDKLMQTGEENLDSSSSSLNNSSTEQLISFSTISLNQDQLPTSSIKNLDSFNNGVNDVDQQRSEAQGPVEEILKRNSQIINASTEIKMEENITSNLDNVKPATSSGAECIHELPPTNHEETTSDIVSESNQLQHGGGESSFSVAGPISGLITYSGPIASSGSMSLRSDGSNTSVRSFAFPILQTEWNSSPVRMAKVDQRRSKNHGGWKQALMCCKF